MSFLCMSSQLIPYKRHVSLSMCEKLILHTIGLLYYVCCWSDVCVEKRPCLRQPNVFKQTLTCIVQNKLRSKDLRAVIVSCNMNTSLRGPDHIDDQSLNGLITCTTMLCPLLPSISLREDRWDSNSRLSVRTLCCSQGTENREHTQGNMEQRSKRTRARSIQDFFGPVPICQWLNIQFFSDTRNLTDFSNIL